MGNLFFGLSVLPPSRDHFRLQYLDLSAPTPQEVGGVLRAHRGKLMVAGVLGVGALALTAFGLAPSLSSTSTTQAQATTIVKATPLAAPPLDLQATALPFVAETRTQRGDTARAVLQRLDIEDNEAEAQLRQNATFNQLLNQTARTRIKAHVNDQKQLTQLQLVWMPERNAEAAQQWQATRQADGQWAETQSELPLTARTRLVSGRIASSLFAATDALDVPDSIASNVAEIFSNDIDFRRDLRKDDRFTIAYEEWTADGEVMRVGQVLGAEFVNKGEVLSAIWFADKGDYFDAKGNSSKRQFLSSPMKFSRVTSGFAMRFHPIQKTWKRHLGVDYGAPTGTPVRSIGAGRVVFAGKQNGYGNVVEIQHDARNRTLYAHLSRIDVRKGQTVEREQNIGAVGQTGWATGPHLHFEFRVDGVHKDPLVLAKRSKALTLTAAELERFKPVAQEMLQTLAKAGSADTASAR